MYIPVISNFSLIYDISLIFYINETFKIINCPNLDIENTN